MKYNYPQLQGICATEIRNNLCTRVQQVGATEFQRIARMQIHNRKAKLFERNFRSTRKVKNLKCEEKKKW